ncbi:MAG TPA: division/cell wall cluster transcriptional repressor MraZ [Baekduia sp.]|nr:division/cell wall cluster transcriptional repressor MraZ [Baekduia sp.]
MDTSFTGQADYTLDAKNRLTVPARYRGSLEGGVVLAKDIEPCVAIWPTAGYDEFRHAALQGVHPMSQRGRKIMTFLSANSMPGALDSAGRVPLQPFLMEHGDLTREVTVVGAGDHLQIWNRERWAAYNAQLAEDIFAISEGFDAHSAQ